MTHDNSTIYVDGNLTSDSFTYNPNTRDTSGVELGFKTINSALLNVGDGGTIYVRAGTYSEKGQSDTCYPISKPLSILAYNNEAVTLTYPAGSPPLVSAGEFGYIVKATKSIILDGLTLIGTKDEGDPPVGDTDVTVLLATEGSAIRRCKFQKWGHAAVKFGATSTPVIIEQNVFEAGGFTTRDHHIYSSDGPASGRNVIRHNTFIGSAGYAIHLYDRTPANHDIYGNLIFSCAGGGILLGGAGHGVYNNTIYGNTGYAGLVFWKPESTGNIVKNNIIKSNTADDITLDDAGTETAAYNNKHDILITGGSYNTSTDLDTDPVFASATPTVWTDFALGAESPMLNAGELLDAPYNQVLDQSVTTAPTPKTITAPVIGAMA